MSKSIIRTIVFVLLTFFGLNAVAQPSEKSKFDSHALFHPLFNFQPGNDYRTGSGAPGPFYWQNKADYKINATLDESAGLLSGDVEITYKNNSKESLEFVWLQLDQNAFNDDSRGGKTTPITGGRFGNTGFMGGIKLLQSLFNKGRTNLWMQNISSPIHVCRYA